MGRETLTAKKFTMNILNGVAIGTILALIPGALLGLVIGVLIGYQFKFTPIQTGSLGLAVFLGGGVVDFTGETMTLSGAGDVINMAIAGAIAAGLILLLGDRLKAYTILLIPPIVLIVGGGLGLSMLPLVSHMTTIIEHLVAQLLILQPVVMSVLIAIIFSIFIVTPVTTVGIAVAISLAGIGSGAANLGICAAGFGLAIAGWNVNSVGTSLAYFIGSPKMSMPNMFAKPKILLPIICNAACLGVLAALFNIQGTPMSAGFGFSGRIGPENHLNLTGNGWSVGNLVLSILIFLVAPIILGLFFSYLFTKVWQIISPNDYKLDIQ